LVLGKYLVAASAFEGSAASSLLRALRDGSMRSSGTLVLAE
jgi:hypothetical protein